MAGLSAIYEGSVEGEEGDHDNAGAGDEEEGEEEEDQNETDEVLPSIVPETLDGTSVLRPKLTDKEKKGFFAFRSLEDFIPQEEHWLTLDNLSEVQLPPVAER
ncbi:hypothetical protein AK812_SmicGene47566, partial [Symbiodinium microadriaticum]